MDCIVGHLDGHSIINDSQHGFRSRRSCLMNLLYFLEDVTSKVDEGYPVDEVYLDFSKAFDEVPQKRLTLKVKAHSKLVLWWPSGVKIGSVTGCKELF